MSISVEDKVLIVPTASGKRVGIPLAAVSIGDKIAIIPTSSGKKVAVKLSSVEVGDNVLIVPTTSGKKVAIKTSTTAPVYDWYLDDDTAPDSYCAIFHGSHHFMVGCSNSASETQWAYNAINGNVPAGIAWGSSTTYVTEGHNTLDHAVDSMVAISDSVILAGVNSSGIWKTEDGGSSWTYKTYFGSNQGYGRYTALISLGGGVCLCASSYRDGTTQKLGIYRSTDSGDSWSLVQVVESATPFSTLCCFADCGSGVVLMGHPNSAYNGGSVWRSTDSGATWAAIASPPTSAGVASISNLGSGVVLAGTIKTASSPDAIWKSTDSGATWTKITDLTNTRYIYGVVDMGSGVVFAGGTDATSGNGNIWKSTDSGDNWSLDESFTDGGIVRAMAAGNGHCIAVTLTGGHVWVYR